MSIVGFDHRQSAHCESGVLSSLLRHNGLDLSEPMVFGLSNALMFAYIPIIKMGGLPLIAYRSTPGSIIKGVSKRLKIDMVFKRFRQQKEGMDALIEHAASKTPVGLQTSVYWLPYFPADMRFHFNAHNLVVYGYDDSDFYISDPTLEMPVKVDYEALQKARFVKGALAPKGLLYYPKSIPSNPDLSDSIHRAIKANTRVILKTPVPVIGIKGVRFVARKIAKLESTMSEDMSRLFLGHMVRMQEEIGTGGAGFRFLYASFLQESARLLDNHAYGEASINLTEAGDQWRKFALYTAKMCKGRMALDYKKLSDQLLLCADLEEEAFQRLL